MTEFSALRAFIAVVDGGSFSEAAAALGVSRMTVARRVTELEEALSQSLLVRSEAGAAATTVGRALHAEAHRLLAAYTTLLAQARGPASVETVVVVEPGLMDVVVNLVVARAPEGVRLRLRVDPDPLASLQRGQAALVAGATPVSPWQPVWIGQAEWVVAASADYIAAHGRPVEIEDLARHRIVAVEGSAAWPTRSGGRVKLDATVQVPRAGHVSAVIMAGAGIGWVQARPELVTVLPDIFGQTLGVWLVADPQTRARLGV